MAAGILLNIRRTRPARRRAPSSLRRQRMSATQQPRSPLEPQGRSHRRGRNWRERLPCDCRCRAMQALADIDVVFCGTARGLEHTRRAGARFSTRAPSRRANQGRRPNQGSARSLSWPSGQRAQSFAIVRSVRPSAVLSVGGYAAGPVSLAAAMADPAGHPGAEQRRRFGQPYPRSFAKRAYLAWATWPACAVAPCVAMACLCAWLCAQAVSSARSLLSLLVLGGSQGAARV